MVIINHRTILTEEGPGPGIALSALLRPQICSDLIGNCVTIITIIIIPVLRYVSTRDVLLLIIIVLLLLL